MAVSRDEFRHALSRFASGVTVVSSRGADGRLHGMTVSAFCSVSLEPPLILICIEKRTGSYGALMETKAFTVNILGENQSHLSEHFASLTRDKFGSIKHRTGSNGLPIIDDAAASLECRLEAAHEAGDHAIFVGRVDAIALNDTFPLVYLHGRYRQVNDGI